MSRIFNMRKIADIIVHAFIMFSVLFFLVTLVVVPVTMFFMR